MSDFDQRPIGVFDSGIGGLTVLRELLRRFPNENFYYLGDTARLPYGSKSAATVRRYSEQNMQFLVERNVKAIVVACNTASTQVNEQSYYDRPVYNVIDPGARVAAAMTENNRIGVIGTRATVRANSYEGKIKLLNPAAEVFSCPIGRRRMARRSDHKFSSFSLSAKLKSTGCGHHCFGVHALSAAQRVHSTGVWSTCSFGRFRRVHQSVAR
jgi:glutamate racemase